MWNVTQLQEILCVILKAFSVLHKLIKRNIIEVDQMIGLQKNIVTTEAK